MNAERPAIELIERGMGWWECPLRMEGLYGDGYWEEYRKRDQSKMGRLLTKARVDMVKDHCPYLVDVGIGGGAFIKAASIAGILTQGTDVNPHALKWLESQGKLWYFTETWAMTFWDSIEHIEDPASLLAKTKWAFISTPVYDDEKAVRASKHFKPGEHIHYWSTPGLIMYMGDRGFELKQVSTMESDLGREDIRSFAFKRP